MGLIHLLAAVASRDHDMAILIVLVLNASLVGELNAKFHIQFLHPASV